MYNNLFIDSTAFRPPNSVETKFLDLDYTEKWDGMDGTTNFHKTVLAKKRQKILNFQYLTDSQFNFLLTVINNGFYFVNYVETSFAFAGQYLIELEGYSDAFGGGKAGIVLVLTPQFIE